MGPDLMGRDLMGRAVRVRVPATSANLGPGFDALGLALTCYDEVTAEITQAGLSIEVTGEGAAAATAGERHLIVRTMRAEFARAGVQPAGLRLRCVNAIPQSRGLGSSAGAIVAGLLAARALAGTAGGSGPPLVEATRLEGHPDNVAACLTGGLIIAWTPGEPGSEPKSVRLDPHPEICPVVCVPASGMSTEAARKALPATVPHRDATAAAGRSALLVAALTQRPDLLFDATEDLLHEPYRRPLMPASADLIGRLRAAGIAAVLSGAGPSVLALTVAGNTPGPDEVGSIAGQAGTPWHVSPLDIDKHGATSQSVPPGAITPTRAPREPGLHEAPAGHKAESRRDRGSSSVQHGQL
jgi:homoserine kinase